MSTLLRDLVDEQELIKLSFMIDMAYAFGCDPPRGILRAHARLSYKFGYPWAVQHALSMGWPNSRVRKERARR